MAEAVEAAHVARKRLVLGLIPEGLVALQGGVGVEPSLLGDGPRFGGGGSGYGSLRHGTWRGGGLPCTSGWRRCRGQGWSGRTAGRRHQAEQQRQRLEGAMVDRCHGWIGVMSFSCQVLAK